MRLPSGLISIDDVMGAVNSHIDAPSRLLPVGPELTALGPHRADLAAWVYDRLQGVLVPTKEETVGVSKSRHGIRPVAVWDIGTKITYSALVTKLDALLPSADRALWRNFERRPLEAKGRYIVTSDIAACYQNIDHGLLADELLVQTGQHAVVESILVLLKEATGRTYGIPQQSTASDLLAEAFLAKLERSLVRRGLTVARFNDDFRFTCTSWSEAVRSIEVLDEESRAMGLNINDMKTVTWGKGKYREQLTEAVQVRDQILEYAEVELSFWNDDPYDQAQVPTTPAPKDVEILGSKRILERWRDIAGKGNVQESKRLEHRALVRLLPFALRTLSEQSDMDTSVLDLCTSLLRFERTSTPSVSAYLSSRSDGRAVVAGFDRLLRAKSYLNGWQAWWLQNPVGRLQSFTTSGRFAAKDLRQKWARGTFHSTQRAPVLHGHLALTLAVNHWISEDDLLELYSRSNNIVRPILAAALAYLKPAAAVRAAVVRDSKVCEWVFDEVAAGV